MMKRPFHPYLVPVWIKTQADLPLLDALVAEMKKVCEADPHTAPQVASANEAEAHERAKRSDVLDSGHLRFVQFGMDPPVNLCLTLDVFDKPTWNLSMSVATGLPTGPLRVEDARAAILAKAFLGEGYEEVPPQGAFKQVRQFLKAKD